MNGVGDTGGPSELPLGNGPSGQVPASRPPEWEARTPQPAQRGVTERARGAYSGARLSSRALFASEVLAASIWTIFSFIIVYWACEALDLRDTKWLVIFVWVLSGLVALLPGIDGMLSKVLLGVRLPTTVEEARIGPVWKSAAAKIGMAGPRHSLWIEDSKEVTTPITIGRTVGVTHWALNKLSPALLEAVMVRELASHMRSRSSLSRLGSWYSIPARLVAVAIRSLTRLSRSMPVVGWAIFSFLVLSYLGVVLAAVIFFEDPVGPLLYLLPLLAPLVLAGVRHWNERMADRAAADLGFGPQLIEVFYLWQAEQKALFERSGAGQLGWLDSNRVISQRIRALEIYQRALTRP